MHQLTKKLIYYSHKLFNDSIVIKFYEYALTYYLLLCCYNIKVTYIKFVGLKINYYKSVDINLMSQSGPY